MYRTPRMGLSWRPSSAGRLFGNVELLGYLTCQTHASWALQVACGSRCSVYLAIRGLYLYQKSQKSCILHEKDRNLFLKTRSNRPKVQLWHTACMKAAQIQTWGLASLWFTSNTWYINTSSASFRNYSKLCSRANCTWPACMKRPSVNTQHSPKSLLLIPTRKVPKVNLGNLLCVTWSVSRTFRAASRESWSRKKSVIRELKCLVHHIKEETISSVHVIIWCPFKTIIHKSIYSIKVQKMLFTWFLDHIWLYRRTHLNKRQVDLFPSYKLDHSP